MRRAIPALLALAAAMAGCDDEYPLQVVGRSARTQVVVLHASPTAPALDVFLDSARVATNLAYGQASAPVAADSGSRRLRLRQAGTTALLAELPVALPAGGRATIALVGPLASLQVRTTIDTVPLPAGRARLRFLQAAAGQGLLDLYLTAPNADLAAATPTATNLDLGSLVGPFEVGTSPIQVRLTAAGGRTLVADTGPFAVPEQTTRLLVLLEAPGGGPPLRFVAVDAR